MKNRKTATSGFFTIIAPVRLRMVTASLRRTRNVLIIRNSGQIADQSSKTRIGPEKRDYRQLGICQFPHDDKPTYQELVNRSVLRCLKNFEFVVKQNDGAVRLVRTL